MKSGDKKLKRLSNPIRSLTIGFSVLSLIGAVILSLPISSANGEYTSFLDALFTSTSAVTTTGLIVVDTGSYFNRFGQTIIMILFQIGGLGYMIFVSLAILGFAGKISLSNRLMLRESVGRLSSVDLIKFAKMMILTTIIIELLGIISLTYYWSDYFPFGEALYSAAFHSISAFTTAGFSIYADSFMKYAVSPFLNFVIIILCILGSVGFFVIYEVGVFLFKSKNKFRRLSTHSKIVLSATFLLILLGTLIIYFEENWNSIFTTADRIELSLFQASSASTTAGYNTIDIGLMSIASLFILIILMYIGAGPGGTAGGIKQTTMGVILIAIYNQLTGRENVMALKRRISESTIKRALSIAALALLWLITAVLILTITEKMNFIQIVFEVSSALGTVGLSTGVTSSLSVIGKIVITLTMFIGRVGPLGIGLSVIREEKVHAYQYPEDEILVG